MDVLNFLVTISQSLSVGQTAMKNVEMFDWNTNTWRGARSMNRARFGHALVTVGAMVLAIGGDDRNPSNILDTIEEYDLDNDSWKILDKKLSKPRSSFGFTLVPHSVFPGCVVSGPLEE